MAKKLKNKRTRKLFSIIMVLCMLVGVLPLQAFAVEDGTTTEIVDGVEITTTQTTEVTTDGENTTITVTIEKTSEGTQESTGKELTGSETFVTSTTTDAEGNVVGAKWTESGKETITQESTDTPDVTVDLIKNGEKVEGANGSAEITAPDVSSKDPKEGEDDLVYDEITDVTTTDREVSAEIEIGQTTENKVITDAEGNVLESYESEKDTGLEPIVSQWDDSKQDVRESVIGMTEEEMDALDAKGLLPVLPLTEEQIEEALGKKPEGYDYLYIGLGEDSCFGVGWNYRSDASYNDYGTGTHQFALGDFSEENLDSETLKLLSAYCADLETSSRKGYWYKVTNLEDAEYFNEESANHIRAIAANAYWGTVGTNEDGTPVTGSLAAVKAMMANAKDSEGNAIFSQEQIDGLTEGEALTASQIAIWQYGNPYQSEDKNIYLDADVWDFNTYQGSSWWVRADRYLKPEIKAQVIEEWGLDPENLTAEQQNQINAEVTNRYNEKRTAAMGRINALSDYLIGLTLTAEEAGTTQIINEKNFVEDMSMTVGSMVKEDADGNGNNSYNVDFTFSLVVTPGEDDDLIVKVVNSKGEVVGSGRIAGDGADDENMNQVEITYDENGKPIYTLKDMELIEGSNTKFNLTLEGAQYLEQGVYIYSSEVRDGNDSQTFVGMAEGYKRVDVAMEVDLTFHVKEGSVTTVREWANEGDPTDTPPTEPEEEEEEEEEETPPPVNYRVVINDDGLEEIPDEPVPLASAPKTGDTSGLWAVMIATAALALIAVNISGKKNEEE